MATRSVTWRTLVIRVPAATTGADRSASNVRAMTSRDAFGRRTRVSVSGRAGPAAGSERGGRRVMVIDGTRAEMSALDGRCGALAWRSATRVERSGTRDERSATRVERSATAFDRSGTRDERSATRVERSGTLAARPVLAGFRGCSGIVVTGPSSCSEGRVGSRFLQPCMDLGGNGRCTIYRA